MQNLFFAVLGVFAPLREVFSIFAEGDLGRDGFSKLSKG